MSSMENGAMGRRSGANVTRAAYGEDAILPTRFRVNSSLIDKSNLWRV